MRSQHEFRSAQRRSEGTLTGHSEALRGRSEALRECSEDTQRRSEVVQRTLRGAQRTLRGLAENVQRTRRGIQRTLRGRAEDAQRRSEAAQRMFRGRSEARSGVNCKRTSNHQHGSAADTGPAWPSVHPHTRQWSSHLPARVKICAFEPVIAQKVRTHLN